MGSGVSRPPPSREVEVEQGKLVGRRVATTDGRDVDAFQVFIILFSTFYYYFPPNLS